MIIGISLATLAILFLYCKHGDQIPSTQVIRSQWMPIWLHRLGIQRPGAVVAGTSSVGLFSSIFGSIFGPRKSGLELAKDSVPESKDVDGQRREKSQAGSVGQRSADESNVQNEYSDGEDGDAGVSQLQIHQLEITISSPDHSPSSSGSVTPKPSVTELGSAGIPTITLDEHVDVPRLVGISTNMNSNPRNTPVLLSTPSALTASSTETAGRGSMPPPPFIPARSSHRTNGDEETGKTLPMFPSAHSAQRASAPSTRPNKPVSVGLAPTTARQRSSNPTLSAGLSRQRMPPGATISNNLLSVASTTAYVPNPRKMVALAPGFSPMDWALKQKSGQNLSGISGGLLRVTPSELKRHNGRGGTAAWSEYQGKVYNITEYIPFHPGGKSMIKQIAGKPGEKLFNEYHSWVSWDNMLNECLVGIMVSENDVTDDGLDDMD